MSLLDGLIAHWKLDEASGDRLDSSGNGHTLSVNTGPASAVAGKLGLALTNGKVLYDGAALSNFDVPDGFTIAGWLKMSGSGSGSAGIIFDVQSLPTYDDICFLQAYENEGQAFFVCGIAGTDLSYPEPVGPATLDEWHLALGWWVKGEGVYVQVDNGTPILAEYAGDILSSPANTFVYSVDINSAIDSPSFWRRVLTAAERSALWNRGAGLDYPFTPTVANSGGTDNYYYWRYDQQAALEEERQLMAQMEAARRAVWQKPRK